MGRIRILSDEVANKIAAGEVIERPASVVKELIENSLDAEASEVRVEVAAGGRRLIRVADDGCGMGYDDALLAFERHATSKLREARDLLAISTLGFRGEALPSIAAVSRLTLETRAADELTGTRVEIAGGKILSAGEVALPPGTAVTVRDLFFNMPARRKFLRSEQTELAHIAALVTQYSLAYPEKSFSLRHEARTLLEVTPVERLRDRVYQVFGHEILQELVDLGVREGAPEATTAVGGASAPDAPGGPLFRLRGFVSQPHYTRTNRNSIYLFVNRRLIRDRLLLHALLSAYRNLTPPDVFPFALLFLDCDPAEVDVNVHPAKTEVRFRRSQFVHDFVRDAVREALAEVRPVSSIPLPAAPQPAAALPYSEFSQHMLEQAWQAGDAAGSMLPPAPGPEPRPQPAGDPLAAGALPSGGLKLPLPDTHRVLPPEWVEEAPASMSGIADLRPLGQIHDSFIVAAGADGLWLVDQHVAHERILFEKFLRRRQQGRVETQVLLVPLILTLTPAQQADYERIAGELHAAGFEIEPFGRRTVAVKTAPAGIQAADLERALLELLEPGDDAWRRAPLEDVQRRIAAALACRAAIKIRTPLDPGRMEWLLRALAATQCPMSCPHGRPTVLRYPMREILKAFRRI